MHLRRCIRSFCRVPGGSSKAFNERAKAMDTELPRLALFFDPRYSKAAYSSDASFDKLVTLVRRAARITRMASMLSPGRQPIALLPAALPSPILRPLDSVCRRSSSGSCVATA